MERLKNTPPRSTNAKKVEIIEASNDSISKANEKIDINQEVKIDEPVYRVQIGAFKEALPLRYLMVWIMSYL